MEALEQLITGFYAITAGWALVSNIGMGYLTYNYLKDHNFPSEDFETLLNIAPWQPYEKVFTQLTYPGRKAAYLLREINS